MVSQLPLLQGPAEPCGVCFFFGAEIMQAKKRGPSSQAGQGETTVAEFTI